LGYTGGSNIVTAQPRKAGIMVPVKQSPWAHPLSKT